MTLVIVLAGVLVSFAVIMLFRITVTVPEQYVFVLERLEKDPRVLTRGVHTRNPFVEIIRAKVDLREQIFNLPPQRVVTADNLAVSVDTVVFYKVVDPVRVVYEITNHEQGIEHVAAATLRDLIGSMDVEQSMTARDVVNTQLRTLLGEGASRWGIEVTHAEVKSIERIYRG